MHSDNTPFRLYSNTRSFTRVCHQRGENRSRSCYAGKLLTLSKFSSIYIYSCHPYSLHMTIDRLVFRPMCALFLQIRHHQLTKLIRTLYCTVLPVIVYIGGKLYTWERTTVPSEGDTFELRKKNESQSQKTSLHVQKPTTSPYFLHTYTAEPCRLACFRDSTLRLSCEKVNTMRALPKNQKCVPS